MRADEHIYRKPLGYLHAAYTEKRHREETTTTEHDLGTAFHCSICVDLHTACIARALTCSLHFSRHGVASSMDPIYGLRERRKRSSEVDSGGVWGIFEMGPSNFLWLRADTLERAVSDVCTIRLRYPKCACLVPNLANMSRQKC
jgi:hypothetical protein